MAAYKKRFFKAGPLLSIADRTFKPYLITRNDSAGISLNEAQAFARTIVAEGCFDGLDDYGVGYLIRHVGDMADWLLLRLWIKGEIVAGILAADRGRGYQLESSAMIECVWESVITDFERRQFVETMLRDSADRSAYLATRLPEGTY